MGAKISGLSTRSVIEMFLNVELVTIMVVNKRIHNYLGEKAIIKKER